LFKGKSQRNISKYAASQIYFKRERKKKMFKKHKIDDEWSEEKEKGEKRKFKNGIFQLNRLRCTRFDNLGGGSQRLMPTCGG
jgi:hypothetical protein